LSRLTRRLRFSNSTQFLHCILFVRMAK
jgi:hypothetical protein